MQDFREAPLKTPAKLAVVLVMQRRNAPHWIIGRVVGISKAERRLAVAVADLKAKREREFSESVDTLIRLVS